MPLPFGDTSVLSQLEAGSICTFKAILYLDWRSTRFNGKTHWISASQLSRVYEMSLRWVREILYERLMEWVNRFKIGRSGSRYLLKHHACPPEEAPLDKYGDPKFFAVALGVGGPFDRLYKGEISRRACLIWIVLRYYSEWDPKKGHCVQTHPMTMEHFAGRFGCRSSRCAKRYANYRMRVCYSSY